MTHVLIKIADGAAPFNIARENSTDLVPSVVEALKTAGLQAWGWQYIYGYDAQGEAQMAIKRLQSLGLDGFVIDAEGEFKQPGRASAARRYAQELRSAFPDLPLALSSYRFPSYHRAFPWSEFLEVCNLNMPQVYWEKAHNPAAQLKRCVSELTSLKPSLPVVPTAPAYKTGGWRPTPQDLTEFLDCVHELKLNAANFFSWDECSRDLPELWKTMSEHAWPTPVPVAAQAAPDETRPTGLLESYFQALNSQNLDDLISLYHPDAVHISDQHIIRGHQPLRDWYQDLWGNRLPQAAYTLQSNSSAFAGLCRFTWQAQSAAAQVNDGSDALGILDGKIVCHYTRFSLSQQV